MVIMVQLRDQQRPKVRDRAELKLQDRQQQKVQDQAELKLRQDQQESPIPHLLRILLLQEVKAVVPVAAMAVVAQAAVAVQADHQEAADNLSEIHR